MQDEIERAVRRFIEEPHVPETTAGPLVRLGALNRQAIGEQQRSSEILRLQVVRVAADEATVDVDARWTLRGGAGEGAWTHTVAGPMTLVREGDLWKVTDYRLRDRFRLASLHLDAQGEAEAAGLRARVLAVDLGAIVTQIVLEVESSRDAAVRLEGALVGAPRGRRWRFARGRVFGEEVPPGGRTVVVLAGKQQPLEVDGVGVQIEIPHSRERLALAVPLRSGAVLPPLPRAPHVRLPTVPPLLVAAFFVAVLGYLVWSGSARFAALLLLAPGLVGMVALARAFQRGARPALRLYALVLSPLVAGAAILLAGREGGPLGCPSRDGPEPRRAADAYVRNVLVGNDDEAAARLIPGVDEFALTSIDNPVDASEAARLVEAGRPVAGPFACDFPFAFPGVETSRHDGPCFAYPAPETESVLDLTIGVSCHERRWRVSVFPGEA